MTLQNVLQKFMSSANKQIKVKLRLDGSEIYLFPKKWELASFFPTAKGASIGMANDFSGKVSPTNKADNLTSYDSNQVALNCLFSFFFLIHFRKATTNTTAKDLNLRKTSNFGRSHQTGFQAGKNCFVKNSFGLFDHTIDLGLFKHFNLELWWNC